MKKTLAYLFIIFLCGIIIVNPGHSINYALDGLGICYEVIIPSLFPFFVSSGLLVYSGFSEFLAHIMRPVMKPLFNVGGAGSAAFVLGIISGYPLGAVTACQLYEGGYLSKSETERLLAFSNNSGPLFILGSVGISMYHSLGLGVILYISHILSAITVGIIMRNYKKTSYTPPYSPVDTQIGTPGEIFQKVLSNAINSILTVCGAVIFCSVISKLILELVPVTGVIHSVILGAMEFVSGMAELSGQNINIILKLMLASWIVGFAGISVHLQVMAVAAKDMLSLKPYIFGKALQGLISCGYTIILWKFFSPYTQTSAGGAVSYAFFTSSLYTVIAVSCVIGIALGVGALLYFKENNKNNFVKKNRKET